MGRRRRNKKGGTTKQKKKSPDAAAAAAAATAEPETTMCTADEMSAAGETEIPDSTSSISKASSSTSMSTAASDERGLATEEDPPSPAAVVDSSSPREEGTEELATTAVENEGQLGLTGTTENTGGEGPPPESSEREESDPDVQGGAEEEGPSSDEESSSLAERPVSAAVAPVAAAVVRDNADVAGRDRVDDADCDGIDDETDSGGGANELEGRAAAVAASASDESDIPAAASNESKEGVPKDSSVDPREGGVGEDAAATRSDGGGSRDVDEEKKAEDEGKVCASNLASGSDEAAGAAEDAGRWDAEGTMEGEGGAHSCSPLTSASAEKAEGGEEVVEVSPSSTPLTTTEAEASAVPSPSEEARADLTADGNGRDDGRANAGAEDTPSPDGTAGEKEPAGDPEGERPKESAAGSAGTAGEVDGDVENVDEGAAEAEADVVTLTFRDYVDLQTSLVLLPLDDEECLGARVASYDPSPPTPLPSPSKGGGGGGGGGGGAAGQGITPSSTFDGDLDDVSLSGDEEKKQDGELLPPKKRPPSPPQAQADAGDGKENERPNPRFPSLVDVDIVGYVLDGVGGAEEGGEWTDNEFSYILAAIRGAPTPIELRFVRPAPPPSMETQDSGERGAQGRTEVDASSGIVVEKEEGPKSPPAAATSAPSAPPSLNLGVLSPQTAARATALGGRLAAWGSKLRTSAEAAAAEAKERAAEAQRRAAARAREIAAERAEARRVEERLRMAEERAAAKAEEEEARVKADAEAATARRRGEGDGSDDDGDVTSGGEKESSAGSFVGDDSGSEKEEEEAKDVQIEFDSCSVSEEASVVGEETPKGAKLELGSSVSGEGTQDGGSTSSASSLHSQVEKSLLPGRERTLEAVASPQDLNLSKDAEERKAQVVTKPPKLPSLSDREDTPRKPTSSYYPSPRKNSECLRSDRDDAASKGEHASSSERPFAAAKIGKPPMVPKRPSSVVIGPAGRAAKEHPPPFPRIKREIEVPSVFDAAAAADDDGDVPCGMYLQTANGKFAPVEYDEVLSPQHASVSAAPSSSSSHGRPGDVTPPLGLVRSGSYSSFASAGSGGSRGSGHSAVLSGGGGSNVSRRRADPHHKSSRHPVTNTSVLHIRASADAPCPVRGCSYQWYRSYNSGSGANAAGGGASYASSGGGHRGRGRAHAAYGSDDDSSLASSSVCSGYNSSHAALGGDVAGWFPLKGATYAAFQPSATDVGHRVRCVVTIDPPPTPSSPSSSSSGADGGGGGCKRTVVCELPYPVVADPGLFNAARKSFFEGGSACAMFGGLDGRGNAEGRSFRLEVSMGFKVTRADLGFNSRLVVCQVAGRTAEPMHDRREPIRGVSAVADASQPKAFELIFPIGLPPSAGMIEALCADGEHFLLRAPNRVTRESFLLALGIANFGGHPSDLDVKTILFPGLPPGSLEETNDADEHMYSTTDADTDEESSKVAEIAPAESKDSFVEEVERQLLKFSSPEKSSEQTDEQFQALEDELRAMLEKLFNKEKVVSDLQRRLAQSESELKKSQDDLSSCRKELQSSQDRHRDCQASLRMAEEMAESCDSVILRMKGDHATSLKSLGSRIMQLEESAAEYQKNMKSLENEKAVLSAAVEARDGKLARMSQLQSTVDCLQREVAKGASVQRELNDMTANYHATKVELLRASAAENECQKELLRAKRTLEQLNNNIKQEKKLAVDCKSQMENIHMKYQKVKAERNSYKQKADSLSKEMSRICRNGVSIADIEKMMEDHQSTKTEVALLKTQKRKALEDLETTRKAHEHALQAHEKAGIDGEAVRALEQKAELERVVSDLTEYVGAKEMQLETLKEVNRTLTEELHMMAQANLGKNDI